jgi:glycyl-tRNA synthetase alpha subunit
VRALAKGVAEAYLAQRETMGFPLLPKAAHSKKEAAA